MNKQLITKTIFMTLMLVWLIIALSLLGYYRKHALIIGFLIISGIARFLETFFTGKQNILDKRSRFDRLFLLLAFCYLLILFGSTLEIFLPGHNIYVLVSLAGLVFFCSGLALRWWAITSLGAKWNTVISRKVLRKNTRIRFIRRGPYRYIRHPMYAGTMLELIGIPLVCNAYLALLFSALVCLPLLMLRAVTEEKLLDDKFGGAYRIYKSRTGALIPRTGKSS